MPNNTKKNHLDDREAFRAELLALAGKYQMGVVASFERKDYATRTDIDAASGILVHMMSRADMAQLIQGLIDQYPELAHILLLGKMEEAGGILSSLSGIFGRKENGKDAPKTSEPKNADNSKDEEPGLRVMELKGKEGAEIINILERLRQREANKTK